MRFLIQLHAYSQTKLNFAPTVRITGTNDWIISGESNQQEAVKQGVCGVTP
jgi:hypothetical protein